MQGIKIDFIFKLESGLLVNTVYEYSQLGFWERWKHKLDEGPLVFVFLACTVGCLTVGMGTMKSKSAQSRQLGQYMMRGRVGFQGLAVLALIGTTGAHKMYRRWCTSRALESISFILKKMGVKK